MQVRDLDIAYEEHGSGRPLLFIAGLTATRYHWLGFDRRFADAHRVITFDNRGVGETTVTRAPYSTVQMAEDALGLLDALGIDQADIVGTSMGGMIAQELALLAPDRVRRLVLVCTHPGGAEHVPPPPEVNAIFAARRGAERTIRELMTVNLSAAFRERRPDVVEAMVAHGLAHRMEPFGFVGQVGAIASHDVLARLPNVTAPTLVVHGDADDLVPLHNGRLIASRIPGARLAVLPGAGHMLWAEMPDEAEALIREHLA